MFFFFQAKHIMCPFYHYCWAPSLSASPGYGSLVSIEFSLCNYIFHSLTKRWRQQWREKINQPVTFFFFWKSSPVTFMYMYRGGNTRRETRQYVQCQRLDDRLKIDRSFFFVLYSLSPKLLVVLIFIDILILTIHLDMIYLYV